jgi:class 3 adenylate cyclase/tetratricopeptide (TPR) repeat protein
MKCPNPKCQFENSSNARFCRKCGNHIQIICPACGNAIPPEGNFCDACGCNLTEVSLSIPITEKPPPQKKAPLDQGRKYVTVLFSDLSGYTAMSETLDPEEVKEIMGRIYGEIVQVVVKYEGHIDKFIGDAVMVLFGIPLAHEDDPVRAIRAAHEIHEVVKGLSPSLEKRIGRPLAMHTGINTGVVVTGEINLEKGIHGVLGDTINVASRLCSLAKPDEIMVGHETYHEAEGYFHLEEKEPATVKGKAEPIKIYKVLSAREAPSKTHRLSGLRAELIGRRVEMAQLQETLENLKQGNASIFSIIGDAGTGKSRLIEEFRNTLNLDEVQWREGHAYAYSQNIPYFPLIDLLNRAWQIREGDHPDEVRLKVERGAGALIGERKDLIPYVGSLYALPYQEIEQVSPENWKARLHEAIQLILASLCKRAPTIIHIEDLHWADPSSIELLQNIIADLRYPVLFLCIYRPPFSLFTSHQASSIRSYDEIRLQDLSPSDAQDMVGSLLRTDIIPRQLRTFIRDKAEGNPFYLEEVINSLIETDTLVRDDGSWKLVRSLTEKDIPSTVQGVISARLDRLERETKRILQEASVIGRSFLYDILKKISDLKDYIDRSLINLEHLDLIKTRSLQPDLEYIFKNALTQEVVYNGLLIKERRPIHEKIGSVMEELFRDRLPEFYETLAYHYSLSENTQKACDYLKLAGDKAARSYAHPEAIRFYQEALKVLDAQPESEETRREKLGVCLSVMGPMLLIGYPEGSMGILQEAERLAQEFGDERGLASVYVRMGHYHTLKGNIPLATEYSEKCFDAAEKIGSIELMAQNANAVCVTRFMTGNCLKVVELSRRTLPSLEEHHREKDLYAGGSKAYSAISGWCGMSLGMLGEFAEGKIVLEKGLQNAWEINDRYITGWVEFCHSHLSYWEGDGNSAVDHAQKAIKCLEDTGVESLVGSAWSRLGQGYYLRGEYETAREHADKGFRMQEKIGIPFLTAWCSWYLAMILCAAGDLIRARECAEKSLKLAQEHKIKNCEGMVWMVFGSIKGKMDPACIDEAQYQIRDGITIVEKLKQRPLSAIGYLLSGELFADAGCKEEAMENLKKAESLYLEMKVTPKSYWLKKTQEALAKLEVVT